MKSKMNLASTALLIATLFAVSFTSVYVVAQNQDAPTKADHTAENAKTPLEHHKIAMYYQQEAIRLNKDAESHRAYANIYAKGLGLAHCTNLTSFDEQTAKEAEAPATMHEEMTKAAEQKN